MTSIQYNKRGADQHIVIITCIAMLKPQMYWLMGINMSTASHTQHGCGEVCSGDQLQEATTSTQSISVPWNITNSKDFMETLFCKCRLAQDSCSKLGSPHPWKAFLLPVTQTGWPWNTTTNTTESKYSGYYSKPANRWELVELGHLCSVQQAAQ